MLSLSGGMSAGTAGNYYGKEDYYLSGSEGATQWLGVCIPVNPTKGTDMMTTAVPL